MTSYKFTARVSGSQWRFELPLIAQAPFFEPGGNPSIDIGSDGKTLYMRQWWERFPKSTSQATMSSGTVPVMGGAPAVMWVAFCGTRENLKDGAILNCWNPRDHRISPDPQLDKAELTFTESGDFLQSAIVSGPANELFPGFPPAASNTNLVPRVTFAVKEWASSSTSGRYPATVELTSHGLAQDGIKSTVGAVWTIKTETMGPLVDRVFVPPVTVARLTDLRTGFVPAAEGWTEYMITNSWPEELPPAIARSGGGSSSPGLEFSLPVPERFTRPNDVSVRLSK